MEFVFQRVKMTTVMIRYDQKACFLGRVQFTTQYITDLSVTDNSCTRIECQSVEARQINPCKINVPVSKVIQLPTFRCSDY
jgi:hypothetical protein